MDLPAVQQCCCRRRRSGSCFHREGDSQTERKKKQRNIFARLPTLWSFSHTRLRQGELLRGWCPSDRRVSLTAFEGYENVCFIERNPLLLLPLETRHFLRHFRWTSILDSDQQRHRVFCPWLRPVLPSCHATSFSFKLSLRGRQWRRSRRPGFPFRPFRFFYHLPNGTTRQSRCRSQITDPRFVSL